MKELAKSGGLAVDLATAFDASPNPYVLLTPDLRIAGMNQAYLDVTSSAREDIVGRPLFAAFDSGPGADAPENVLQVKSSLEKARDSKRRDHLALVNFSITRPATDGSTAYEERYWSATHTPILNADGEVIFILQHTTDITELERLRQDVRGDGSAEPVSALDAIIGGGVLRRARLVQEDNRRLEVERNRLVELFMQAPGFVAILSGPEHVVQMYNSAYALLIGRDDISGKAIREALPDIEGQGFFELLDSVYRSGRSYEGRDQLVQLRASPEAPFVDHYLNFIYQPIRDNGGQVVGIFVQGHDVTDSVLAAQRQKLMIDELNHRVKNTLATVQSIAIQTARSHADPKSFAGSFQARLLALSHTHDLLTRSHWESARLHEILQHETEAHGSSRVLMNGPNVPLEPAQALSLGMIFHELATNAVKYGALSAESGQVLIDWRLIGDDGRRLAITWRERHGPPVTPPDRRGFGTRLIERNVHHDLAGALKLDYADDGLVADLEMPLDREHGT